jgi:hypothetical protein
MNLYKPVFSSHITSPRSMSLIRFGVDRNGKPELSDVPRGVLANIIRQLPAQDAVRSTVNSQEFNNAHRALMETDPAYAQRIGDFRLQTEVQQILRAKMRQLNQDYPDLDLVLYDINECARDVINVVRLDIQEFEWTIQDWQDYNGLDRIMASFSHDDQGVDVSTFLNNVYVFGTSEPLDQVQDNNNLVFARNIINMTFEAFITTLDGIYT